MDHRFTFLKPHSLSTSQRVRVRDRCPALAPGSVSHVSARSRHFCLNSFGTCVALLPLPFHAVPRFLDSRPANEEAAMLIESSMVELRYRAVREALDIGCG